MDNTISTEEKILNTAMEVFLDKGLHGAKMQEIADAAGINKAMLHYYFRSKDKLYTHVFEKVFARVFGELHTIFASDESFKTQVETFVNKYIDLINSNPRIPLFIIRELGQGGEVGASVFKKIIAEHEHVLPQTFMQASQKAIQKNEIRETDPRQLLITLLGSCVFFFISEPMISVFLKKDPQYNRQDFIEARKNEIVNIIFNGIKP